MAKKMFNCRTFLISITFLGASIVSGCDLKVKPIEGGKEIAQEVERHKIKRLTQNDILKAAQKAGDSVVVVAQQELDARLQEELQKGGVAAAMAYCQPENYEAVNALEEKFGATAQRTGTRLRNPANKAGGQAAAILAQYEKGALKEPQVVALNNEELLYTSPIYIRNQNCLNCHGTIGQNIAAADYEKIKQKYPTDAATGYQTGELRGMWHITFRKKEFIAYLNDQPKKSRRRR
ncbi:c-type heme family protein [Pontibacter ruber]|uniref:DUF3365 domain-containing protein n=1 Tax=Pontibacter ruber TaxID=1343895 RepID=A0ABW5CXK7_9BACT|nr:DUF3365 domain-containing protein [Pontibacter ruber]